MLNITNHQRNAHQNHNQILPYTNQKYLLTKSLQIKKVSENMEKKLNPSILLVRLQIGTASKENSMEFPLKKLKIQLDMIQQSHSWIYIQRKWKH